MCKVQCECGPNSDKHGWVAGPVTKTILTISMLPQGIAYLQISGFWRGCRFVRVRRK